MCEQSIAVRALLQSQRRFNTAVFTQSTIVLPITTKSPRHVKTAPLRPQINFWWSTVICGHASCECDSCSTGTFLFATFVLLCSLSRSSLKLDPSRTRSYVHTEQFAKHMPENAQHENCISHLPLMYFYKLFWVENILPAAIPFSRLITESTKQQKKMNLAHWKQLLPCIWMKTFAKAKLSLSMI